MQCVDALRLAREAKCKDDHHQKDEGENCFVPIQVRSTRACGRSWVVIGSQSPRQASPGSNTGTNGLNLHDLRLFAITLARPRPFLRRVAAGLSDVSEIIVKRATEPRPAAVGN